MTSKKFRINIREATIRFLYLSNNTKCLIYFATQKNKYSKKCTYNKQNQTFRLQTYNIC